MVENMFFLDGEHVKIGGIVPPKNIVCLFMLPPPYGDSKTSPVSQPLCSSKSHNLTMRRHHK